MNRLEWQKSSNPYAKYKYLLNECAEITYESFETTIRQVNELAASLLDITCSSVWMINEIEQSLQCVDIYSKNLHKHKKLHSSLAIDSHREYIDALKESRYLILETNEDICTLHHRYLAKHGIVYKFDTALYYNGILKGILCFESTDSRNFIDNFTKEVALTLAKIVETAINLQYKRENEEIFQSIVNNAQTGILIFQEKILYANDAMTNITGFSPDELKRMHPWDFVEEEMRDLFRQRVIKRVAGEFFSTSYNDIPMRTKSGNPKIVRGSVETILYEGGYAGIAIITDITDLVEAREKVRILAQAVEQMDEFVKITDVEGNIVYVNNSLIANTGYKEIELIGKNPRIFKSGKHKKSFYKKMWDTILNKKIYRNFIINKKKDGTLYYEDQTISPILNKNGKILYFVATSKDVSSQIQLEERLRHMATTDALTGIYNRYKMNEELELEIKKAKRYKRTFALIMFDIDYFKQINDTYGHDAGDRVLEELATLVSKSIRETDAFARWGGEEFLILVHDSDANSSKKLAEKIRKKVERFFFADAIQITISLGIAVYDSEKSKEKLLKEADEALYKAKELGRNKTVVFQEI